MRTETPVGPLLESWCDPATRWTLLAPAGSVPVDASTRAAALEALQALPVGTQVTLAGRRGLRRIARQAGVEVAAEYVALPSAATPVAVAAHGAGLRWVADSVLTVPSGRSRGHLAMTMAAALALVAAPAGRRRTPRPRRQVAVTTVEPRKSSRRRARPHYAHPRPVVASEPVSHNGHHPPVAPVEHPSAAAIPLTALLSRPGTKHALLAGSRDPNAKLTVVVIDDCGPAFAVKMATTPIAADVVRAEGALLGELHQLGLGALAGTVPRPVGYATAGGLPGLVTGALPGRPMTVAYHAWRHTAQRRLVRADYAAAGEWLAGLQRRTAGQRRPITMLDDALMDIEARFGRLRGLRAALGPAARRLRAETTPRTAVHGDYWFGNLLVNGGTIVGVVDWEAGQLSGEPLRDIARFAVSYSLYLDRHTAPGSAVRGHRGLRADEWGAGLLYAATDTGWYGQVVREFCAVALTRLGADPALAADVLLAGIADVAATADHGEFAAAHLEVLTKVAAQT